MIQHELFTVPQFCEAYGISRTTFYAEVKAGRLRIVKIGAATRVRRADAQAWADSLPTADASA
jgi:excisionase family DNA binding protein